jgi:hypothetical protein
MQLFTQETYSVTGRDILASPVEESNKKTGRYHQGDVFFSGKIKVPNSPPATELNTSNRVRYLRHFPGL